MKDESIAFSRPTTPWEAEAILEAIQIQEVSKRLEDHEREILMRLAEERRFNLSRRGRFKSWRRAMRWRMLCGLSRWLYRTAGVLESLSDRLDHMAWKYPPKR